MTCRQHGGNTATRRQTWIVNGCKTVQVASNGATMRGGYRTILSTVAIAFKEQAHPGKK